ncbi:MAG: M48 family metalloprotease [Phycisphaerae bacterium]|nr:M48 family metalloprotease [Phycisphaerae bacterium]
MHLLIVMSFGLLIWRTGQQPFPVLVGQPVWSVVVVVLQIPLWWVAGRMCSAYALRRLRNPTDGMDAGQVAYHRTSLLLRILIFAGFAAELFLTRWANTVENLKPISGWPGIADLIILSPLVIALVAMWHGQFPIDQALRERMTKLHKLDDMLGPQVWTCREYLSFNVRHQILIVGVPMSIIFLAYRICEHYRSGLVEALLFSWVPDAILGLVVVVVFVFSPVLLKSIWTTAPLEDGPLRQRLERACRRTGLRCRGILAWDSHGMMVNAVVMGIFARWRYVLLSDGLLEGLSEEQIEAVFGHEAGHVRHHHMAYFFLFALVSVLFVSGIMEIVVRLSQGPTPVWKLCDATLEGIGLGLMVVFWGVFFGWLSRRFERQADVFGAHCVTPPASTCHHACGVHPAGGRSPAAGHSLCVAGATVFVSALDRVAILNGIPHEQRSWRHSSIISRMRFLMTQAGDPTEAEAFHRLLTRIKRTFWVLALVGCAATVSYCLWQPDYRELILRNTIEPLTETSPEITPR